MSGICTGGHTVVTYLHATVQRCLEQMLGSSMDMHICTDVCKQSNQVVEPKKR